MILDKVNCADSVFIIFESIEPGDYGDSGDQQVVTKWSVGSGCQLSENIWFSWSKTCYKGEKVRCHACAQTDARTCERRAVFCLDRTRNICFADFSENLQYGNRVQRVPRARWHAVVMGGPWTQGHLRLSTLNRLSNVDRQSGFRSKGHLLSVVQSNNNLLYNMYSIKYLNIAMQCPQICD